MHCPKLPFQQEGSACAQAGVLEIEAGAKRRLAGEYDAAQARGEVRQYSERGKAVLNENSFSSQPPPTLAWPAKPQSEKPKRRATEPK
jgi:hypothetical protein